MKRGAPDHPKTKALAKRLGLRRWQVVGVLECLWHFTAAFAKRGDIGKWTDCEIAAALEWEGNCTELIQALVDTHWLDRCDEFRLLVHDWTDHADQTVGRSEEVKKLGFASMQLANASKLQHAHLNTKVLLASRAEAEAEALPSQGPRSGAVGGAVCGGGDLNEADWEEVRLRARRFVGIIPAKDKRDREIVLKACALVGRGFPEDWVEEAREATQKKKPNRPGAYFTDILMRKCSEANGNFKAILASITVPPELLNGKSKQEAVQ